MYYISTERHTLPQAARTSAASNKVARSLVASFVFLAVVVRGQPGALPTLDEHRDWMYDHLSGAFHEVDPGSIRLELQPGHCYPHIGRNRTNHTFIRHHGDGSMKTSCSERGVSPCTPAQSPLLTSNRSDIGNCGRKCPEWVIDN